MANLASINVRFLADLKQFSTQMQNAERQMQSYGKSFTKIGKSLSLGVTAPLVALGAASVISFDKQAKAIAQVEAGLKSTENAVGKTSSELQRLAVDLQKTSLFGDEEILKDVTAQLLTFTNIAGTQFDRTQQAALDLATRLDGDLKSASIQLGKALNDPIANLSALSRSGIQFSQDQKAVIKSLTETGRLADAQTIILDELEKQYGGAAAAAAKAGTGPFKQLQNSIGDLTEDFGKIISEALLPFIESVKEIVQGFSEMDDATKKNIVVFAGLAAVVGPLLTTLGFMMTTVIPGLITAFNALKIAALANPFTAVAVGVGLVIAAFVAFNDTADDTIAKQSQLVQINNAAAKSIANERAKLNELLVIARDEKVSKEQRIKAIKELNQLAPKYLGDLTVEKINTDAARVAIDKYNESLLRTARVKAAQAKLQEIESQLIDIEIAGATKRNKILTDEGNLARARAKSEATGIRQRDIVNKQVETLNTLQGFSSSILEKQRDALLEVIKNNQDYTQSTVSATAAVKEFNAAASSDDTRLPNVIAPPIIGTIDSQPMAANVQLIRDYGAQVDEELLKMQFNAIEFNTALAGIMESTAENFAVGFGQLLGNAAQGGNFLAGFFKLFVGTLADMAIQVGKTAIGIGIAVEGIKKALTSLSGPVAIAAGIALVALGNFAKSALGSIAGGGETPFANGGIVYGPTRALVGEYAGARNNPEVIAPLNKLKNLINPVGEGGTTAVQLEGEFVLRGNDLVQLVKRVENRNNRTQ